MIRIGVVADTHGLLRPEVIEKLKDCDAIVHAGDIGDESILAQLREVAPVHAVLGNCDFTPELPGVAETEVVPIGNGLIYVLHDLERLDLDPRAAGFSAVITGHTHKPLIETRAGVLFLNPGSCGPRRFDLPVSMAQITIDAGQVRANLISLNGKTSPR